jgi:hypothetical protein
VEREISQMARWISALVLGALILHAPCALRADPIAHRAQPGPFRVGVRTLVLRDESRHDGYAEAGRTLIVEVWYPAADAARGPAVLFSEFFGRHRDAAERFVEHFGGTIDEVNERFPPRVLARQRRRAPPERLSARSPRQPRLRHRGA